MTWKKKESDYKFIEDEVRLYHYYVVQLQLLQEEMEDDVLHSTPEVDKNGGGKSNLPSRPTENKALSLFSIKDSMRMKHLKLYISAIEQALSELDDEKKRFIERLYWKGSKKNLQGVAMEFAIGYKVATTWQKGFLYRVAVLVGVKRPGKTV